MSALGTPVEDTWETIDAIRLMGRALRSTLPKTLAFYVINKICNHPIPFGLQPRSNNIDEFGEWMNTVAFHGFHVEPCNCSKVDCRQQNLELNHVQCTMTIYSLECLASFK